MRVSRLPTLVAVLAGCTGPGPQSRQPFVAPEDSDTSVDSATVDTDSSAVTDSDAEDSDLPEVDGPTLYFAERTHSPITPWSTATLRAIAANNPALHDNVFMKVGASSTVSTSTLYCFAGNNVVLDSHAGLQGTLDFFLGGDADGTTPFDRDTIAAESGVHAGWAIEGDPAPVEEELAAISPRLGIIHYGANDMGWGSTYEIALDLYFRNMSDLMDILEEGGTIPVLTGISRRPTNASADYWVNTWNAAIRGMAQDRQVPFIDLEYATQDLNNYGVSDDGLHLNGYSSGTCVFTDAGLEYGYNVRNLIVLEALDRVHRTVDLSEDPPDVPILLVGTGSGDAPWKIPALPFAHVADTAESGNRQIDEYTGCEAAQDESGPEYSYEFTLAETQRIRFTVSDRGESDIDVHLLDASGTAEGCIARGHRSIAGELQPGTYRLVLDTWTSDEEWSGEYLMTAVPCQDADAACDVVLGD